MTLLLSSFGPNTQSSGFVQLQDKTIDHVGFATSVRTAGIRINTNGTVQWLKTYQFLELIPETDWIIPNQSGAGYQVGLFNLVWIDMDEGFIISPSGNDNYTIDPIDLNSDGDPNGDVGQWFDLSESREWVFVDHQGTAGLGLQHATFDIQIRFGAGPTLATAQMDWKVDSAPSGGGGGGCFEAGTRFRMSDGSVKKIEDITIHDEMELGGKVTHTIVGDGMEENWFNVDGIHVTGSHIMKKGDEWMHVRNGGFEQIVTHPIFYILINDEHRMVAENGQVFADFMDEAYYTYGDGWDDFIIDVMNGKLKMKYVDYEKQKYL